MNLDFGSLPGVVIVSMIEYLTKVLDEWPEILRATKINPHTDTVFTTCNSETTTWGHGITVPQDYS